MLELRIAVSRLAGKAGGGAIWMCWQGFFPGNVCCRPPTYHLTVLASSMQRGEAFMYLGTCLPALVGTATSIF
jgi:hypothetical protein